MTEPTGGPSHLPTDPVLAKRARIRTLTELGQRLGYGLYGIAIVLFVVGFVVGYTTPVVTIIVTCLIAGSVVLAPAIVFAYGVKAADRDDREREAGGPSSRAH